MDLIANSFIHSQIRLIPPITIVIPPSNVTGSLNTGKISNNYGVVGLPTRFLVDMQGIVRYRAIGGREFDHPEVEKLVMQLISE